jgi:hypothetical protein
LFAVPVFYFSLTECNAQAQDFQTWSSVTFQKSFSKKVSASAQQQLRLNENSAQLRQIFTDAGFKYEVIKNLSIAGNYRFIVRPGGIDHRAYADLDYSWKKKKLAINPRARLQHDFVDGFNDNNYLRGKLTLEYRITKKWKPFIAGELFYRIFYYRGNKFDEYRLNAGTNFDLNKKNSFKISYLMQQEFNVNARNQNHILAIGYEYDL